MKQVTHADPIHREFSYFQHKPSVNETTVPCLQARQSGVSLDPNIQGGGSSLCQFMGYAASNSEPSNSEGGLSKEFPQYLTLLLGTPYPINSGTVPLTNLNALLSGFNTPAMDNSVQQTGYTGYVNFLTQYYQEQLGKTYTLCGTTEVCPSIFYLPYAYSGELESWPPKALNYWGMSGGGGSGAGYQIQAFKPGSDTHYTLFAGGGGGGGGSTTPEGVGTQDVISLLNAGSGGGGGSQFADCYVTSTGDNLNGLGLGAGTGSGLSTPERTNISFQKPPAVDYSFYAPGSYPEWNDTMILNQYGDNLTYLFNNLIPSLYQQGYTIVVHGGGGGGTGLEFLNQNGEEFTPHPVSIGYGFNFCYAFNKQGIYTNTDCVSSRTTVSGKLSLDQIIYQNIGLLYKQAMEQAVLPQNCNGYTNYTCTCMFQHQYVLENLTHLLVLNGFSSQDIPSWLLTPHCNSHDEKTFLSGLETDVCIPPWSV